jgi:hypothetical protein
MRAWPPSRAGDDRCPCPSQGEASHARFLRLRPIARSTAFRRASPLGEGGLPRPRSSARSAIEAFCDNLIAIVDSRISRKRSPGLAVGRRGRARALRPVWLSRVRNWARELVWRPREAIRLVEPRCGRDCEAAHPRGPPGPSFVRQQPVGIQITCRRHKTVRAPLSALDAEKHALAGWLRAWTVPRGSRSSRRCAASSTCPSAGISRGRRRPRSRRRASWP